MHTILVGGGEQVTGTLVGAQEIGSNVGGGQETGTLVGGQKGGLRVFRLQGTVLVHGGQGGLIVFLHEGLRVSGGQSILLVVLQIFGWVVGMQGGFLV